MSDQLQAAHVKQLLANPAWQAMQARLLELVSEEDFNIEHPDPFTHGKAVGKRKAYRNCLNMPAELLKKVSL